MSPLIPNADVQAAYELFCELVRDDFFDDADHYRLLASRAFRAVEAFSDVRDELEKDAK